MSRCLVLGANGFIGSHLVDALAGSGHQVVAFGRFRDGETRFNKNPKVELFDGDFLNSSDVSAALDGVDYVFHFISTTTPITAENDPLIDIETNIQKSVELFQECVRQKVKKVIFASTGGAIYGADSDHSLKETDIPLPVSPYAIGKLTIEQYLRYFRVKHGLQSMSLRISNPYGERQPLHRKQGVIPIFMQHLYNDKPLTILGDGSMVRDYIYVKDVAKMVAETFEKENIHDIYNLGSGEGVSLNELVEKIENATERSVQAEYKPAPSTFVHKVILDTTRFSQEFNVRAETTMADGMKATWKYIVEEHEKEESLHDN